MTDFRVPVAVLQSWWAAPWTQSASEVLEMDPLARCAMLCLGFGGGSLVASWVTGNCSQVDKLWSITPVVYAASYWTGALLQERSGVTVARLGLLGLLVLAWGARLSYNFARKGGYAGEEDYRWPALRKLPILGHPLVWQLFNVTFIAGYQHVLLLCIVLPMDVIFRSGAVAAAPAWLEAGKRVPTALRAGDVTGIVDGSVAYMVGAAEALEPGDWLLAGIFLCFLFGESLADEQQWKFQERKKRLPPAERRGDFKRGFLTAGLFTWSRHPNFFCEQAIWVTVYGFSIVASGAVLNWSLMGAAQLILLFQGSTRFTEALTKQRHPQYAEYQKTTSMLVPWPPRHQA